jgi:hypothetical protein
MRRLGNASWRLPAALLGLALCLQCAQPAPKPEDLLAIIAAEQVKVTGYSTGFDAYNCYTEVHRQLWEASHGWVPVVNRVKASTQFRAVVEQIAAMEPSSRDAMLQRASNSRRPTYAEALPHGPHKDGHSTTDAGAYVESVIAQKIVEAVRSMRSAAGKMGAQ